MAFDERLGAANEKLIDTAVRHGRNSSQHEAAFAEYLEVFKVVAVERGDGVLGYELPSDYIRESIFDGEDAEDIAVVMKQFEMMVSALREVGYESLAFWEEQYNECHAAFERMKEGLDG